MSELATQAQGGAAVAEGSLIDQILDYTKAIDENERDVNKTYIEQFVRQALQPDAVVSSDVVANIKLWISSIDNKLTAQLNEVMHHEDFQKLEGTWRGLHHFVQQTETSTTLKIRVLNVSKKELLKDLEKAVEFDQSQTFKKVYEAEYG